MLFFFFSLLNLNKFFPKDNLAELFFSEARVNFSSVKFGPQVYIYISKIEQHLNRLCLMLFLAIILIILEK